MSIFALNFKFDLQETGGTSDWQSLSVLPSLDPKRKQQIRDQHMKEVFSSEKKKITDNQKREE